ncbi:MAG: TRAP transporter substrate-binding protein DctP [Chloroflexota bacterium]
MLRLFARKTFMFNAAVAVSAALVGLLAAQTTFAGPRKLRVAYYVPATHIYATGAIEPFAKEFAKRSNGQLTVDFYPAQQLGKGPDAIRMVQTGIADLVFMTTVYHSQELPASQYLALPHSLDGMTTANVFWRATHEPGIVKDEWDSQGIVLLTAYANPPSEFSSTDIPLDGPQSLKGVRMRAPGEVLTLIAEAVGAIPVEVTTPDQYEALQRGLIKSVNYVFSSWNAYKLSELLHHSTVGLNIYSTNPAVIASQRMLDSLSPELRKLLIDTGREYSAIGERAVLGQEDKALKKFIAEGLKIYEWSANDKAWLDGQFANVRNFWIEKATKSGIDGAAVAKQFEQFAAAAKADPKNFPSYLK